MTDSQSKSVSVKTGTSLSEPGILPKLAQRISEDLDAHCVSIYDEGFRWHLGASVIGDECKRKLWYGFRWVDKKTEQGRMYRLFNRGHLEESRHIGWLRGMGFTVWDYDTTAPKKADGSTPQFRIQNKAKGHFGGSLDGIVQFPASYGITDYALLSCKTNGTGAGFNKVKNEPLEIAKPEHYTQECVYGESFGIEHVLYINANKNDDDLAIQVVKLDFELAKQMEVKAESVIFSQTPPARYSENPTILKCKSLCEFKDICHFNKPAVKNCRSCVNCSAINNAEFFCAKWNAQIPREEVSKGCPEWVSITAQAQALDEDRKRMTEAYNNDFLIETVPVPK